MGNDLTLEQEFTQRVREHKMAVCLGMVKHDIEEELAKVNKGAIQIPDFILESELEKTAMARVLQAMLLGKYEELYIDCWNRLAQEEFMK